MQRIDWDDDGLGRPSEKRVGFAQGSVHMLMQAGLNTAKLGCSSPQWCKNQYSYKSHFLLNQFCSWQPLEMIIVSIIWLDRFMGKKSFILRRICTCLINSIHQQKSKFRVVSEFPVIYLDPLSRTYTLHSMILEIEEMRDKLLLALSQMNNSFEGLEYQWSNGKCVSWDESCVKLIQWLRTGTAIDVQAESQLLHISWNNFWLIMMKQLKVLYLFVL